MGLSLIGEIRIPPVWLPRQLGMLSDGFVTSWASDCVPQFCFCMAEQEFFRVVSFSGLD